VRYLKQTERRCVSYGCLYADSMAYSRGVQFVHWVMHKCIMVKVGGNKIHVKYVKNTYILRNQRGIWKSRGK